MARLRSIADRAEQLLGKPVASTTPVAGGSICTATRLRLSDGRSAFIKTHPTPPPGFFAAEARGLRQLSATETVTVPEVLAQEEDCLMLAWVEHARPTPESAALLGQQLARLHRVGAPQFGAEQDGFIASLPLPNSPAETWPEFYATRRVLPYLKLASDRGNVDPASAKTIDDFLHRLTAASGPAEPPALIHGDLWNGNIVWSTSGPVLVDPAAHGGHRETDLAMLALFGVPHLDRVLSAYETEFPLADGWQERQGMHQLHPLLVHAALFGGQYGARAAKAVATL